MNKAFSEGFMQDIADLLEYCVENKTDSVELNFEINGTKLQVDIAFSIGKKVGLNDDSTGSD